jgi:hydroxymethylpyrimidine pyrophosphatase-like HAD family hydrolase
VVGVGDAENDQAFLNLCGCSVSVANALPALRERTHLVMKHAYGRGVVELIDRMIEQDGFLIPMKHAIGSPRR